MNTREFAVYNIANVEKWEAEVLGIPGEISQLEQQRVSLLPTLNSLSSQASSLNSQIASLNSQISALEARQMLDSVGHVADAMHDSHHHHHGHHDHHGHYGVGMHTQGHSAFSSHHHHYDHHHHSGIGTVGHAIVDASVSLELSRLRSERAALYVRYNPIREQLNTVQSNHDALQANIRSKQHRLDLLRDTHIPNARAFLGDLFTDTKNLVQNKIENFKKQFENYIKNHPLDNQPVDTRRALYRIQDKLNLIAPKKLPENTNFQYPDIHLYPQDVFNVEEWQKKYAILTGFIAAMIEDMRKTQKDRQFIEFLEARLFEMHIEEEGYLPDNANTNKKCKQHFDEFAEPNALLYKMTNEDFLCREETDYEIAIKAFSDLANSGNTPLHKLGQWLIQAIKEDVEADNNKKMHDRANEGPNYNRYERIASLGCEVLDPNVSNSKKQSAMSELLGFVNKLNGASSTKRKVFGCFLGFVGLSLLIGSVLLFPPFGPLAAMVGGGLLTQGLLILGATFGLVSVIGGGTMFHFGRERATAKTTHDFVHQGAKAVATPGFFVPTTEKPVTPPQTMPEPSAPMQEEADAYLQYSYMRR